MLLTLPRLFNGTDSTIGMMMIDGKVNSFTLEDEPRAVKVRSETRIPAGLYEVKFRECHPPNLTPLTKKYRARHPWFKWHIEIVGVPGFTGVYIHIGNTEKNTDACVLIGKKAVIDDPDTYRIEVSTVAYEEFYKTVEPALNRGERVQIHILD